MIQFVVALPAEARPLTSYFRLHRDHSVHAFELYRSEDMALVVSGVGRVRAAGAVGFLGAVTGDRISVWLNLGIAGHRRRPVGELILANKVTDAATRQSWYPQMLIDTGLPRDEVVSADVPESGYERDTAFDMEASGFYTMACRFSTVERVHCLKVISDNAATGADRVSAKQVERLISQHLEPLGTLVHALAPLALDQYRVAESPVFRELTARCRFTETQRHQLGRLLRSLPRGVIDAEALLACRSADEVLRVLNSRQ